MSDLLMSEDGGPPPLTDEEREGLIPSYITLRGELNAAEQANILKAEEWAFARSRNVLDQKFLNTLHERMFGNVWRWAGKFRRTGKNVGVDPYRIATELKQLTDDCTCWVDQNTYESDEIAARFHHRLVFIHPYANGSGRHGRLAADLLLTSTDSYRFSWGSENLIDPGETRSRYIAALRSADDHDYAPLLKFARS